MQESQELSSLIQKVNAQLAILEALASENTAAKKLYDEMQTALDNQSLYCPITYDFIANPYKLSYTYCDATTKKNITCANTYEYTSINSWLNQHHTDPLNRKNFQSENIQHKLTPDTEYPKKLKEFSATLEKKASEAFPPEIYREYKIKYKIEQVKFQLDTENKKNRKSLLENPNRWQAQSRVGISFFGLFSIWASARSQETGSIDIAVTNYHKQNSQENSSQDKKIKALAAILTATENWLDNRSTHSNRTGAVKNLQLDVLREYQKLTRNVRPEGKPEVTSSRKAIAV